MIIRPYGIGLAADFVISSVARNLFGFDYETSFDCEPRLA